MIYESMNNNMNTAVPNLVPSSSQLSNFRATVFLWCMCRGLWQKLLTFNKNMTTSASIIKDSQAFITNIDELVKTSELEEGSLEEVEKKLTSVADITKVKAQLQEMDMPAATEGVAPLQKAIDTLMEWARKVLCPDLDAVLAEVAEQASQMVPIQPGATTQQLSDAYSGKLPDVPEAIRKHIRLRCS